MRLPQDKFDQLVEQICGKYSDETPHLVQWWVDIVEDTGIEPSFELYEKDRAFVSGLYIGLE